MFRDSVSPCVHTGARPSVAKSPPLGSDGGAGAPGGHRPPGVSRTAEGLPGPPLAARGWTQLVAHVSPSRDTCSFPGVAGPPGPPPCSTGLAASADREGEPAPLPPRGSLLAGRSRRRRRRRRRLLELAGGRRRRRHGHGGGPHWSGVLGAGPSREPHPLGRPPRPSCSRALKPCRRRWRARCGPPAASGGPGLRGRRRGASAGTWSPSASAPIDARPTPGYLEPAGRARSLV